ncbi:MAG: Hsp20/alpha crystallin family protein [Stellaceae bacterium]
MLTPQINVSETDDDIRITADLPGLDEDDVELTLADDMLTISGEREAEEDKTEGEGERSYHVVERSRGAFSRTLQLPFSADPDAVEAVFKNGVLAITIPKPRAVQEKVRKIAVKGADAPQPQSVDRAAAGDKPAASAEPAAKAETP